MVVPNLIAEATKKSGLVWIARDNGTGGHAIPVWHHWHDGAAYVLAGGSEQPARGLANVDRVAVTVPSKTSRGRLLTWRATVTRVPPGGEEWDQIIPELFLKRLNVPDGDKAPERWARECTLFRLDPTGELLESPDDMPDDSGAAPPPPTPATTSGPLPWVLGRRRKTREAT
jgi:hypothetical protein